MKFSEQIKERKQVLEESRVMLTTDTDAIVNAFETRIMELESDLDNAREDLENEQILTKKLKGLLDGGLVELVGELVKVVDSYCLTSCPIIPGKGCAGCVTRDILKRAKETLP